jgi:glycine hydroxymethyltransferase
MMRPRSVTDLLADLDREERQLTQMLHMVPSENVLSPTARLAYEGALQCRYSFGDRRFNAAWPAMEWFEQLEQDVEDELALLFGASYISTRPLSGMNAMTIALGAPAPSSVVTVAIEDGGHAVTGRMARRLGATVHHLRLLPDDGGIDLAATARLVEGLPTPTLIYLDQYCSVRPLAIDGLAEALPPGTPIHYDASHVLGLVAGEVVPSPLAHGASSMGGSLHKSFPGPHRGALGTNNRDFHAMLVEESSGWVSHHHPGHTLALAITLAEMRGRWQEYAEQVVRNARAFAACLSGLGVPVYGAHFGHTECHQVFVDVAEVTPPEHAALRLMEAGIRVNAIEIPQLGRVGLRVGLQELTRRGLNGPGANEIAAIVKACVIDGAASSGLRRRTAALAETLSWQTPTAVPVEIL